MPKINDETLRQRYQQAKEAWAKRQKENRVRQRREKAQAEAQRDALIVKLVKHQIQTDPSKQERLIAQMDAFLEEDKERALFDLSPKTAAPVSTTSNTPPYPGSMPRP